MIRLGSDGYDAATRAAVEAIQWEMAQQLLALGVSVILESGFWSRQERVEFRTRAAELGADSKLVFLDVSRDELARRIAQRNASVPSGFFVTDEADLDCWVALFESPHATSSLNWPKTTQASRQGRPRNRRGGGR
jgi:predicted kinase